MIGSTTKAWVVDTSRCEDAREGVYNAWVVDTAYSSILPRW